MEAHRADPVCSSCHVLMDAIGIAMENFDGIGRYREFDDRGSGPVRINAVTTLFDGTEVNDVSDVRGWLSANEDIFVRTMTEKLMQFALARPIEHTDMPYVREIVRRAEPGDYRFSDIVKGIVESVPFQMRINDQQAVAAN